MQTESNRDFKINDNDHVKVQTVKPPVQLSNVSKINRFKLMLSN